jgi:hypothetical protein
MPTDPPQPGFDPATHPKYWLDARRMDYEENPGWIGRVIGSSKAAANNIAFVAVFLTLLAGCLSFVFPAQSGDIWKTLVPVVTLALGYIFGKNSGK